MKEDEIKKQAAADLSPFGDPKTRSIIGHLLWGIITGYATYLCVVDGINSNYWGKCLLEFSLSGITGIACVFNLYYIFKKLKG